MLTSYADLEAAIPDAIDQGTYLIAVDGMDGVGKTTLSKKLGAALSARVVHLDDFIQQNEEGLYVKFIELEPLGQAIMRVTSSAPCVIVEGVCVLAVLDQLGVLPGFHVYVKELKFGRLWQHKDKLYGSAATLDEKLAQEDELNQKFAELEPEVEGLAPDNLRRDLIRYHWRYRPDEHANVVFAITKDD